MKKFPKVLIVVMSVLIILCVATLTYLPEQYATKFVWQMEEYSSKTYKIGF